MRLRLRFLVCLVVVCVCLARGSWMQSLLQLAARFERGKARDPVTLSHTYRLHESEWLEFCLPPASQLVWVLTNANFPMSAVVASDTPDASRPGAIYALEYEFLGSRNEVLHSGTYHFRMRPPHPQEAARPRAFYSAEGLLPGSGQSMRQRLASLQPQPSRLRLRLGDRDERIQDVSVRVYCQDELPEYKLAHAWRRTNRLKRERLCRASVYGPELLTDYERRNLIKKKWLPLAPSGVEGRDYTRRILYSLISAPTDQTNDIELPVGLLVDGVTRGVIPLPEDPGSVRVQFRMVKEDNTPAPEIFVRWLGSRVDQRDHWHLRAVSNPHVLETELEGGLLEIASSEEFTIRSYWRSASASGTAEFDEITPEPNAVRAYVVDPQCAVEYAIEHVGDQPTPLKLAFRQLRTPASHAVLHEESSQPFGIDWCFMGPAGQVIQSGRLDMHAALSCYDRISSASAATRVTDAAVRFFAVPPGVRSVRVWSPDGGVIVSAYSRPPDVARVTFVPEDYSAFHRQQGWRQSWFLLRPVHHLQRLNELQTVTVLVQPRPREVDEQRLAGQYQWESFQPSGRWKGRHLLLPRAARLPLRWESQGSAFYELQTDVDYDLRLRAEPGHRSVAPRLVCQTEGGLPVDVRVYVHDRLHQKLRVRSRLAELSLDALPVRGSESTRVRIETGGAMRVLMNRIEHSAETVFFKRMVSRIEGRRLEFDYTKRSRDEELLSLSLFHDASRQRARLRVKIIGEVLRAAGPSPDWTLLDRVYELRPTASRAVPMFASEGEKVFEQHQCFLRLGSDLPPARYRIEVTRDDDTAGYVLLSRTTSGLSQRRGLAAETEPYSVESATVQQKPRIN